MDCTQWVLFDSCKVLPWEGRYQTMSPAENPVGRATVAGLGTGSVWVGVTMLNIAELDERVEKCLAILADNPRSQVFAALADVYRKRGDFGRAFSVCKSGLKHHPEYASARIVMAKLYLHQAMFAEALASVSHAVELDGPTRASDLLEAEIRVALGDGDGARPLIERLRSADPRNPAVMELEKHLHELADKRPAVRPAPESRVAPMPPESEPPVYTAVTRPRLTSWKAWSDAVREVPDVTSAFAVDQAGNRQPAGGDGESDSATILVSMVREIEAVLSEKTGSELIEIRVEAPDGEVWCRRMDRGLIGFTARSGCPFGAARQAAMAHAEHVSLPAARESIAKQ